MKDMCCDKCGSTKVATLGHISQTCPKTHGLRVKRHDVVVGQIQKALLKNTAVVEVLTEPILKPYGKKTLKPDLVILTERKLYILDVQVTSDSGIKSCLESTKLRKTEKYDKTEYIDEARRLLKADPALPYSVHAFSITWRGNTLRHSMDIAKELRFTAVLPFIVSDVLVNTWRSFVCWHKSS